MISREAALPSEENGGDRWSVDHLFLDQDAIPTLVEVKRTVDIVEFLNEQMGLAKYAEKMLMI